MPDRLGDKVRLMHIRDAIVEIKSYIEGATFTDFRNNSMMHNATYRQLEVIGEACGKISDSIKLKYPSVSWREIIGLRNILIHQYFGVDINIVWHIVNIDIDAFEKVVILALSDTESEEA